MSAIIQFHSFNGDVEVTGSLTKGGAEVGVSTDIPTTSDILNSTNLGATVTSDWSTTTATVTNKSSGSGVDLNFTLAAIAAAPGDAFFQTYGNDIYYTSGRVGIGYPTPAPITNTSAHDHIAYAVDVGSYGRWAIFDASTYAFVEVVDAVKNINNGGGTYGYPFVSNNSLTSTNFITGDHITLNILTGQSQGNGYQSYEWITTEPGSVGRPAKDLVVDGTMRIGSSDLIDVYGSQMMEQAVLRASNVGLYDVFGWSVAMSKDGNTVIVGAYGEKGATNNTTNSGAAYVFRYSSGTWSQDSTILRASNAGSGDYFGTSVAMSRDGNTVIVGSPLEDGLGGGDAGAAYVFRYSSGTWSQDSTILRASNAGGNDQFGNDVAMSGDGTNIIMGAHREDGSTNTANDSGAAYIFTVPRFLDVSTPIQANGTILSFTGQHMCSPHGDMSQGLVVSANKNMYTTLNGPLYSGSRAISSSESLPVVSLSSIENDPSVFGVVDHLEESGTERTQDRGGILVKNTKKLGDDRVIVNSIGEGALWVVNTCGPLISGDLITTSNVHGYAQRQDGTIRRSYTIGKITMDCDFNPSDIPVQVATTDEGGQLQWEDTNQMEKAYKIRYLDANGVETDEAKHVYKAAYVGCTYHCG